MRAFTPFSLFASEKTMAVACVQPITPSKKRPWLRLTLPMIKLSLKQLKGKPPKPLSSFPALALWFYPPVNLAHENSLAKRRR